MRVLLVNGSPHQHGCTDRALQEVQRSLIAEGVAADGEGEVEVETEVAKEQIVRAKRG